MDMCHREHLNQVDLLTPAEKKVTEREYHANRRGQKELDERNMQMQADGITQEKPNTKHRKIFFGQRLKNPPLLPAVWKNFKISFQKNLTLL